MSIQSALVVDDSKVAHIKLRKLLEKRSISVEWVNSGEKAITALQSSSPDVVFMDIMMPGIDGFETTKTVLSNPSNAKLAIVMCSGNDSAEDRKKADSIGAAGYIRKPYTDEDLTAILDEVATRLPAQPAAETPATTEAAATDSEAAATAPAAATVDVAAIIEQATAAGTRAAEEAFARLSVLLKDELSSIATAAARDAAHEVTDELDSGLGRSEVETIAKSAADALVGAKIDKAMASIPHAAPGLDAGAVTTAIRHFVTSDDFKRQVAVSVPAPKLDQAEVARIADAAARDASESAARGAADIARKVAEDTARRAAQEAASGGTAATEEAVKQAVGGLKSLTMLLAVGLVGVIGYLALTFLKIV